MIGSWLCGKHPCLSLAHRRYSVGRVGCRDSGSYLIHSKSPAVEAHFSLTVLQKGNGSSGVTNTSGGALFPTPTSGLLIPLANNIDSDQKLEWSVLVLIPSLPRGSRIRRLCDVTSTKLTTIIYKAEPFKKSWRRVKETPWQATLSVCCASSHEWRRKARRSHYACTKYYWDTESVVMLLSQVSGSSVWANNCRWQQQSCISGPLEMRGQCHVLL